MRYNDYENDILSYGDPTLALAARGDLVKGNYSSCSGATDVKFVSVKELLEGKYYAHIISGPTNEQQPKFSWSNTTCNEKDPDKWYTTGLIDIWNFDWVDYKTQFFEFNKKENDDDNNKVLIIFLCVGSVIVLIIIVVIILYIKHKLTSDNLNKNIGQISFSDDDKDQLGTNKEGLIPK